MEEPDPAEAEGHAGRCWNGMLLFHIFWESLLGYVFGANGE